ncbi:MAG: MBL fold metallo-hydrolase [Syntrophales bacterium]|jgi:glyoxylase-like metal-dependent hydrolase (beta-lactamase superfamily II)|nr:MBL fold metallo-hydrolase [Syntrophales bacterium]
MKFVKKHEFGKVRGWEFGWSPMGHPLMTVISYRIGPVLIDTALSHMRPAVLEMVKREGIKTVLLTHCHEDHSGNARPIKDTFGIPIYGTQLTAEKLSRPSRILPYQHLVWGAAPPVELKILPDVWEDFGLRLLPIPTPGHSRDHIAYLAPDEGWLFSGDLYLSSHIKYFRADERIKEQITSLKKALTLDFDALFCAHHPKPTNGKDFLGKKLQYLEDLYGRIAGLALQGMDSSLIMKTLHLKEAWKIKLLCLGNVSMENLVHSVISSLKQAEAAI